MKFTLVSIFPDLIKPYIDGSILGRAQTAGHISVEYVNPRDFTEDKHHKVDDTPYGGGPGMVMKPEPLVRAIEHAQKKFAASKVVYLEPNGKQFSNVIAKKWSKKKEHIIFVCGRYEGIDERVKKIIKGTSISIGPFVLAGGELPAAMIIEAVARHIPGVLGDGGSIEETRHGVGTPSYTRPESFVHKGKTYIVPKILKEGNHKKIEEWRKKHTF